MNILRETTNEPKDTKLFILSSNNIANVAQFVSFEAGKGTEPKHICINNYDKKGEEVRDVIKSLIESSSSKCVNIRSFSATVTKGNRFVYGKTIEDLDEILSIIKSNSSEGKSSIVNENIDICDCGVSGVVLGDTIEFAPEDTPRCVEKEGVCSLPKQMGLNILKTVYGFAPCLNFDPCIRAEFSIHPSRQGVARDHTIIWEYEYYENKMSSKKISWPNKFSSFMGDKVFGLLVANSLGLRVPRTTVISRKVAPFTFGTATGLKEKWIRTCPIVKEPGKFYTGRKWIDPFLLMNEEESNSGRQDVSVASILSQDEVNGVYSGASFIRENSVNDIIEGVRGNGDEFMVGCRDKTSLPDYVGERVKELNNKIRTFFNILGEVSIEWVYDGNLVWVVQMNQLKTSSSSDKNIIVEGSPDVYEKVFTKDGLDALRNKIDEIKGKDIGIELIGNVGITSHFGDVLRLSNIPSYKRGDD
jgi:hypothetical protein